MRPAVTDGQLGTPYRGVEGERQVDVVGRPRAVVVHGASGHQELTRRQIGLRAVQVGADSCGSKGVGCWSSRRPAVRLGSSTSSTRVRTVSSAAAPETTERNTR